MVNDEEEYAVFAEKQVREFPEGEAYSATESEFLDRLRKGFVRLLGGKAIDDWDEAFAAYVEETKQYELRTGGTWPGMTEDEYLLMLRTKYKRTQAEKGIDDGDEGFSTFVKEDKQQHLERGHKWPGMTEDEYLV
jgi:hypothetical protein